MNQQISDIAELEALKAGSILLCSGNGLTMAVTKRDESEPAGLNFYTAGNPMGHTASEIPLPANLVWKP